MATKRKTAKPAASRKKPSRRRSPKGREEKSAALIESSAESPVVEVELERDDDFSELAGEESVDDPGLDDRLAAEVTTLARTEPRSLERVSLLQRYLAEVRKHPLLTKEEETELAISYREHGDLEAARKLVSSNLRLVIKIALEYYRHWMDLLDLIQEGNVGLMQAVKKFDPYRGYRLSTYSSFWIRAYILKFLMDNWRLVKVGTTQAQRKLFFNLKKEKERLERFGFEPGPKALAESLEVKESEVREMDQRLSGRDESLDAPVGEDGRQTREMTLADDQAPVDEVLAEDQFARIIRRKLMAFRESLNQSGDEKEAFIFDRRLLTEDPITLQEAGDHFGLSRERIRQLEARLIEKIKAYLKEELPDYEDYEFTLG